MKFERDNPPRWFASDNNASVHPAVMAALERANRGHAVGYGDDPWTTRAGALFKECFGASSETFLVWNGTGANVMALAAALRPWEAVVCAETAHINVDETGAPERIAGVKLLPIPADDGKLTRALLEERLAPFGDIHHSLPRMVSVSQPTELGTVYTPDELGALGEFCRGRGLVLHVDGARLANAAVALGTGLREAAGPADLLSFGGTKNGLMYGEALVFLDPALAAGASFLRKNVLQLASKLRYISAQYEAYLGEGLWKENAAKANAAARALSAAALRKAGVETAFPVEVNGVFARIPRALIEPLSREWFFYPWDEAAGLVRWMCSWDTEGAEIEAFTDDLARLLRTPPR
ncbi:MAG: threonine aldolase [Spirochaetales bacterium]|nr:threonine aldolase [Spirochaetales bacterium]